MEILERLWSRIKIIGSYILKAFKWLLKKLLRAFQDIASKWEQGIFVLVMFLISFFTFFVYLVLKDILANNFGDTQWISLKLLSLVVFLFICIFLILPLIIQSKKVQEAFTQYFLFPAISFIFLYLNIAGYVSSLWLNMGIIVALGLHYYLLRFFWKEPNKKVLLCIFLIVLLLAFGLSFVNAYTGEKKMDSGLNDCYANYVPAGEIRCSDLSNHVIADNKVSCFINPSDKNLSIPEEGLVSFKYSDGSNNSIKFYNESGYSFIVPRNLSYIYFEFRDNQTCLSVGYPQRYPTYEEFKSEKNNFMFMILGLLGFCLLSVPIIIKNFSELK